MKNDTKNWIDFKLVENEKLQPKNIIGFIAFCMLCFLLQYMVPFTIWLTKLAAMDLGFLTAILSFTPLVFAGVEFMVLNTNLRRI